MTATLTDTRFCSVCARQAGLDPAGYAHAYDHVLAVEVPLPWPMSMYSEPGVLPQELLDLRALLTDAYNRGEPMHVSAFAISPDPAYSVAGYRRVISYRRPEQPFAAFVQEEYLVAEAEVGPLCWALLIEQAALPRFAAALLPPSGARDLMVCTHGAVDAACAKFGFPIYRHLRRLADTSAERLRVWRVSHFGGHVFAPTLIDMPEFRYWAYVEREAAEYLALRADDVQRLHGSYRGWAGFESALLQVAERDVFMRHGWVWTTYLKSGRVLAQDSASTDPDEPTWAEVQIDFAAPDGSDQGCYTARVELTHRVDCIVSTGDSETYAYPQYQATRLERVA